VFVVFDYVEALSSAVYGEAADGMVPAMVANLHSTHGDDGIAACWTYLCEGSMQADECIAFMSRFKGLHADDGAFARDFLADQVEDALAVLPYSFDWSDYVDWDAIGEEMMGNGFEGIAVDAGVYVWDVRDM
jgi:hypothetical protein